MGVEEWLNFYSTPVRITMRIGPAINFLFHFLQYMIVSVYWSMKLVYLLSCRREEIERGHAPRLEDVMCDAVCDGHTALSRGV